MKNVPSSVVYMFVIFSCVGLASPTAHAEDWFQKGLDALKTGEYAQAVDAFTLAVEAVPHDYEALNNRGFARIFMGDYDGASADCTRAIEINPQSAKSFNNRGLARIFQGKIDEAIADFDHALDIHPRYVDAYCNRGFAWIRKGLYDHAVKDCTTALRINPRSPKALYHRGRALDKMGSPDRALLDYAQALTVSPDRTEIYNDIAWILSTCPDDRFRDGRRAVAFAKHAAERSPSSSFLDTLAAAYAENGRFEDAVTIQSRILAEAVSSKQTDDTDAYSERLARYQAGRPYRERYTVRSAGQPDNVRKKIADLDHLVGLLPVSTIGHESPVQGASGNAPSLPANRPNGEAGEDEPVGNLLALREPDRTSYTTTAGTPLAIQLFPDTPESVRWDVVMENVPVNGTLSGTLPNLIYTPRPGFTGIDELSYRITDGSTFSDLIHLRVTVTAAEPSEPDAADSTKPLSDGSSQPAEQTTGAEDRIAPPPSSEVKSDPLRSAAHEPSGAGSGPLSEMTEPSTEPSTPAVSQRPSPIPGAMNGSPRPDETVYAVQVQSFKRKDSAESAIKKLSEKGFSSFYRVAIVPGRGEWHRIYVGPYASMEEAKAAAARLNGGAFPSAFATRLGPNPNAAFRTLSSATSDARENPYAYQVRSFARLGEARRLADSLRAAGRKAFIGQTTGRKDETWYRVYVGAYSSPASAATARKAFSGDALSDVFLVYLPYCLEITVDGVSSGIAETELRLAEQGFVPYRLPATAASSEERLVVGGFYKKNDANPLLRQLQRAGFTTTLIRR